MKLPGRNALAPFLLSLGIFLAIFGAKAAVVQRFGSDLPYWDQWPGEGTDTFLPWLERHEFWRPLVKLHNEHRIAPTRILCLGLLLAGGQWDARVQCDFNAALHAALVVAFFVWLQRRLSAGWSAACAVLLAATHAPPIVWEDVLGGFQSQYYFLLLFSLVGIATMLNFRALSIPWWTGVAFCAAAIVTMGSGFLGGAAVALVRLFGSAHSRRDAWITLGAAVLVVAVGAWLHTPAPHHASLRAHSLSQFLGYAARCLSWPWPQWGWLWIVFWAPWCVLTARRLRGMRRESEPTADFIVAAGLWVLAQTAAVSYSRGGGSEFPSPRYGDVTGLGIALGFAALAVQADRRRGAWPRLLGAGYAAFALAALIVATHAAWTGPLPGKKKENGDYEYNVRAYLLTGDFTHLKDKVIPFPWPEWLRDAVLQVPPLRALLPMSVREPVALDGFGDADPQKLPYRRIHRVKGEAIWESKPLPAAGGWWVFETSGDLGLPDTSLTLVAVKDGRVLGTIAPTKLAGESWRAAYVRAPPEPALLIARASGGRAFAFSQPVEMASLSYWVWRLGKESQWLGLAGLCSLMLGCVLQLRWNTGGEKSRAVVAAGS